MKYIAIVLILVISLSACNNQKDVQVEVENTPAAPSLPSMSEEELVAIFQATDEVDILFLEKSFSMNAPGNMAKQVIQNISPAGVEKTPCKEICYLFVKSQGEQIAHIGAFLDNGCSYYVFYEDNKPKYINGMTQGGIDFFNRIFAQISTSPQ